MKQNNMKQKPKPPLSIVIKEGYDHFCKKCGSTTSRNGFLGIFGERLCHNTECIKSHQKKYRKFFYFLSKSGLINDSGADDYPQFLTKSDEEQYS